MNGNEDSKLPLAIVTEEPNKKTEAKAAIRNLFIFNSYIIFCEGSQF
jgi:hypothetical protein